MTERLVSSTDEVNTTALPQRRWDIDWLRILAVVALLVPYHTFRVFDVLEDWYVKNDQSSTALNWFNYLGDAIGMQLLFLLAGAATWFALRRRSGGQYAWERVKRLLFPSVFSLLIVVPPLSYFGLRSHSDYAGSFLEWYPSFFEFYPEDPAGYFMGGFTVAHLWFILFLLVISLVALPLFLCFKRKSGQKIIGWLVEATEGSWQLLSRSGQEVTVATIGVGQSAGQMALRWSGQAGGRVLTTGRDAAILAQRSSAKVVDSGQKLGKEAVIGANIAAGIAAEAGRSVITGAVSQTSTAARKLTAAFSRSWSPNATSFCAN